MEEYLKDTYGITVYQEQVMLLSQKLANFSKGDADVLRKAMGKKQKEVLDKMKDKFIAGCKANGHDEVIAEKVWKDWEAFAQYAFNKSHSTCYSLVAYQTAYLKANHTAEYMAAVLTHSQNNLDNVTYFIEECRKQGIEVLGPHVNESGVYFEVNKQGEIRFGLGAIKGAGEAAVEAIIAEREAHGAYKDIFDFAKRLSQRSVNKKTFECLALSGAFDCFPEYHRRQYITGKEGDLSLTEKVIRYASKIQQDAQSAQASLFGGSSGISMPPPKIDPIEPFGEIEKLHFEKEVVGVYISGHPLDNFKFEMDAFCTTSLTALNEIETLEGKECKVGGIVSAVEHRMTKTGRPFGKLSMEDYSGKFEFMLWSDDYLKFKSFLMPGLFLFVEGNVVRKTWGEQNLEFKIRNIDLLNELAGKRVQGIALRLPFDLINQEFINSIEKICKKNSGNANFKLYLNDSMEGIQVELLSRSYRVKVSNELIRELKKYGEVGISTDKGEVRWLAEIAHKPTQTENTEIGTISPTFVLEPVD
jgi:DNA polymerase-3 subunit alpha